MKTRCSVVILLLFGVAALHAQAIANSQISGVVQDAPGAAIPGATVRVTQTTTGLTRTATAASDGSCVIPNLPVGPYELDARASGFSAYNQKGIILQVSVNPVINPMLQIGALTEQVSVTADAAMAETHTNSVSQVIDQERIVDLPLNGRNATQLVLLSGGATNTAPVGDVLTSKNYQSQSVTISIAGSQINGVNYLMDGGDNNDAFSNVNMPFPFPDALQEFSVETSALPARYGLHPGCVVNLVTKSGSNQYHGDLFEFLRNGVFNARNFFAPTRDSLKRNQFGGTFGGPILHDKLFFFTGYQGTRNRSDPATTIRFTPNQAMLNGDFSTFLSKTCTSNPVTLKAPFVNNMLPASMFNAQALALEKYVPTLWFNPKAFAANVAGQYGNAGRDIILGPGFWDLDMGLTRQIPLTERQKLEVRAEAFNILNHANFLPSGLHLAYTDGKFGSITSAMDPRILQFALKYVF